MKPAGELPEEWLNPQEMKKYPDFNDDPVFINTSLGLGKLKTFINFVIKLNLN